MELALGIPGWAGPGGGHGQRRPGRGQGAALPRDLARRPLDNGQPGPRDAGAGPWRGWLVLLSLLLSAGALRLLWLLLASGRRVRGSDTSVPPWRTQDLRSGADGLLGWLALALGLLAEGGFLGETVATGGWPRQERTALARHLGGLFVATGLCAVGEGAGLVRLGRLLSWRGARRARGEPPQTACLPGLVLGLGLAKAAALLSSTPPLGAWGAQGGWAWLTGGSRTGETADPWAAVLPGLVLTLAVAEAAARVAHAEAEVVEEEQARSPRETALLWHPRLRGVWRQGLAACSAEWWVVVWAHAPVLVLRPSSWVRRTTSWPPWTPRARASSSSSWSSSPGRW